ncbi:hypothetical protein EES41_41100 (plasmid) [Streptomyces sp. ADI95-16]|uniref:DUF2637 domain-containing protein n=1 Tax=Streptomyces sp. ADI95-16 TaxID=1522758 RepID=UPI000F435CC8|nr:DUF2637 domain-containing protein [Streptomyces sp. ADI95-16]AYV33178.1 hypothetical protein EES41_41100 [Streptomyces sp. ADI95-16]
MSRTQIERYALVAAGAVIVALTALAFWLSYAHLAEVAGTHGLGHSPDRQWAWPATLDAFIVGGELLMLRAGLQGRTDRWAIGITAAGSVGSIALNVAGVTGARDASAVPVLDYVVAAVPPTAALLAFGVLMRQVHQLVAEPSRMGDTAPAVEDTQVSPVPDRVYRPVAVDAPTAALAPAKMLVICTGHLGVPAVPPRPQPDAGTPVTPASPELPSAPPEGEQAAGDTPSTPVSLPVICRGDLAVPPVPPRPRLGTEAARAAIEQAWRDGLSIRKAALVSTRAPSQVQRVYAALDVEKGAAPMPGQTELNVTAA